MSEWYRWAIYGGESDRMIDHDSGYEKLEDAVSDARAALVGRPDATLAYIEITDGNEPEFVVTLKKDVKTGTVSETRS